MALHPKLKDFSEAKYIKGYSDYLKGIEKDLSRLGASNYNVEIISYDTPRRSLLGRLFRSPDRSQVEETMLISTQLFGHPVEIGLPISLQSVPMPYTIEVVLPVSLSGRAEYRTGRSWGRNGWYFEPADKKRAKELKRSLPKFGFVHKFGHVGYAVQVASMLEPVAGNKTAWLVRTVYEGTFTLKPKMGKYLEAIPVVEELLRRWKS